MSLVRDMAFILVSPERPFVTCSTGDQVIKAATGDVVQSSNGANGVAGRIVDRLGDMLSQRYQVVMLSANLSATRGSTEADRKLTLGVKLQHGDSSGGGDMADYSTGSQPVTDTFFTSARTTPESNWSTGPFYANSEPAYYDLRAAKRFIRPAVIATKNKVTTESSGDEGARISAVMSFMAAEQLPPNPWTSQGSTSTST